MAPVAQSFASHNVLCCFGTGGPRAVCTATAAAAAEPPGIQPSLVTKVLVMIALHVDASRPAQLLCAGWAVARCVVHEGVARY
jgi:hypothetical protein